MSSLDVPHVDEMVAMSPAERGTFTRRLDGERRGAEARLARWTHQVESHGLHAIDGHRSPTAWGKAECNWSGREALGFVKLGRLLARFPAVALAVDAGEIGVGQMHALARVAGNPRVQPHLDDAIEMLVGHARTLDFGEFLVALLRWESLADEDGARDRHERAHRNRRARITIGDHEFFLEANGGNAHGVQLKAILDAFTHSEWLADWEAGVGAHGDAMCPGLLERTDAQRRFDALVAIFHQAAQADGATTASGLVINLVMGFDRFQHHLEAALGGRPAPLDPCDPMAKCETADGVQLDPNDVLVAAAIGHVRRVVIDSAGVVVDVGRKQRLFTGALRDAVMLGSPWCFWPGCNRPSSQCQADHMLPHAHDGPTATHNGGPSCGHHNRWRTRGYTTWRDPDGHWHHHRPDGTEIGWRADLQRVHAQPASTGAPAA